MKYWKRVIHSEFNYYIQYINNKLKFHVACIVAVMYISKF